MEPIRLTLELACSVEHAFTVWTSKIDSWWPADHTVTGRADAFDSSYRMSVFHSCSFTRERFSTTACTLTSKASPVASESVEPMGV